MKKVKIYVVTYRRNKVTNETLHHILKTDLSYANCEIYVINNHSGFYLEESLKKKIKVINNETRPDWSTGNLSENYNQILMHGFKDLSNPDSDIVVHMQNDIVLHHEWLKNLLSMHENYNFVVGRYGDNIVSYTAEAVRKIGLWDERLCSIHHKEGDYMITALVMNKSGSCINDLHHNRLLNNHDALPLDVGMRHDSEWAQIKNETRAGLDSAELCLRVFCEKWTGTWKKQPTMRGWLDNWSEDFVENPPTIPKMQYFIKYPYFEKDLYNIYDRNICGMKN